MRLISILLLAISVITLTILMVIRLPVATYFSTTCRAFMDYKGIVGAEGFDFKGDVSFFFNENKTGRYYISGNMSDKDGNYVISRLVSFKYQYKDNEEYIFLPVSVEKSLHDNISDKIFDRLKRMLPLTQKVSINVRRSENYLLFSNAVSPVFICVNL